VCEARDVKGLYRRARAGEVREFTGISAPYDAPEHAEIVLDTDRLSVEQCVERVVEFLKSRGILAPTPLER
jgi:adenylylsulfate kinase